MSCGVKETSVVGVMNKFEKHPVRTLVLVIGVFFAIGLIVLENLDLFPPDPLLARNVDKNAPPKLVARHIRLKEHLPGQSRDITPPDRYMAGTDTLEQRPYHFETDSDGFIAPSRPYAEPDIEIAFLGGSTTETLYVDPDVRFPYLVSKKLEDALGISVNAINSGVSGNHSMHSNFILMSKILPLQPDFAVMMHAGNDVGTLMQLGSYWNENPHRSIIIRETLDPKRLVSISQSFKSFLYASFPNTVRAIKNTWKTISGNILIPPEDEDLPPPEEDEFAAVRDKKIELATERFLSDFRKSLRTFVDICRDWEITPVLMTQANRLTETPDRLSLRAIKRLKKQGLSYDVMREVNLKFQQAIRDVAGEKDVLLIDLHQLVPQTNVYMYDGMHYNNKGSVSVADIISQALITPVKVRLAAKQATRQ